ncbi:MAG TPA: pyridoxamine 5'-phosphate oxidase family protein [Acidimicrobiia bacterium]|nr:pyridoxamine 5'-phosphate oxidase family protein [Acidimicrobiia bacterium]
MTDDTEPATAFGHGKNQRDLIKMTPDEIDEFVRGWHTMNCATMKADGTIHLVAMWYAFLEGAPALETKAKSQKVLNLRRDPRITCLIEEGDRYEELRGVELVGTGEIVEEHDRIFEIGVSIVERQSDRPFERTPEGIEIVENLIRKRVGVKIHVDKVVSWDHRKLGLR